MKCLKIFNRLCRFVQFEKAELEFYRIHSFLNSLLHVKRFCIWNHILLFTNIQQCYVCIWCEIFLKLCFKVKLSGLCGVVSIWVLIHYVCINWNVLSNTDTFPNICSRQRNKRTCLVRHKYTLYNHVNPCNKQLAWMSRL